jgi:iron uptake system component EfeO
MVYRLLASVALCLIVSSFAGCGGNGNEPSAETARQLQASLDRYETYLQRNSSKLLHWADTIVLKVDEGSFPKAGSRYAAARVPYGHLDPAAQAFVSLNARIDALESEISPDKFGGFHELEKAIFWEESTAGMTPVAQQLGVDIEELQRRLVSADLPPAQIISGATKVLQGILVNEIWGTAEPYAHADLTDIAAKVEGIDAAFKAAQPLLAEQDPKLTKQIEDQLQTVYAKVGQYGILAREPEQARDQEPGISFVVYDQITQEERWKLAQPIRSLARLFSLAEAELDDS